MSETEFDLVEFLEPSPTCVADFDGNGLETAQVRINDTGDLRELQIDFSKEM